MSIRTGVSTVGNLYENKTVNNGEGFCIPNEIIYNLLALSYHHGNGLVRQEEKSSRLYKETQKKTKHKKEKSKRSERKGKKIKKRDTQHEIVRKQNISKENKSVGVAPPLSIGKIPQIPMSYEDYLKQRNNIKEVFDAETGRFRLQRGDGEIIESIVSKERQRAINKKATFTDGYYFSKLIN